MMMEVKQVRISNCVVNDNSRRDFSDEDTSSLMSSIKEQGLLQPIGVRKIPKGYEIVYGNRRYEAMKKLGHKTIPAVIHDKGVEDRDVDIMNLTENIQRSSLTLIEVGRYIQKLEEHDLTVAEIAVSTGLSKTFVTSCKRAYNKVPAKVRSKIIVKSNRKQRKPGELNLSVVSRIVQSSLYEELNAAQKEKLFHIAMTEGFNVTNLKSYIDKMKVGSHSRKDIIDSVNSRTHRVSVPFKFERKEWEKLKEMSHECGYDRCDDYIRAVFNGTEMPIYKCTN